MDDFETVMAEIRKEFYEGVGVNPRGWTVGVGWIDRLRVSGCIHTLEFLRRPVAEGGVQASSESPGTE